jgi:hypothetical protein
LEHRFYGSSLPQGNQFDLQHLQLLTVEQALADLANFVTTVYPNRKVVTFGCSYAGALATWLRVAYPNVTVGTVSSSGVVNPILDFYEFDQQITTSLTVDPQCLLNVHSALELIENDVATDPTSTMARFKVFNWSNTVDFLYFMADASAETVQYGYQSTLCNYMNNTADVVANYAQFVNEFYSPTYLGGDVNSYSRESVAGLNASAGRAWWWQKCSQMAYFQTAPESGSLSKKLQKKIFFFFSFFSFLTSV